MSKNQMFEEIAEKQTSHKEKRRKVREILERVRPKVGKTIELRDSNVSDLANINLDTDIDEHFEVLFQENSHFLDYANAALEESIDSIEGINNSFEEMCKQLEGCLE